MRPGRNGVYRYCFRCLSICRCRYWSLWTHISLHSPPRCSSIRRCAAMSVFSSQTSQLLHRAFRASSDNSTNAIARLWTQRAPEFPFLIWGSLIRNLSYLIRGHRVRVSSVGRYPRYYKEVIFRSQYSNSCKARIHGKRTHNSRTLSCTFKWVPWALLREPRRSIDEIIREMLWYKTTKLVQAMEIISARGATRERRITVESTSKWILGVDSFGQAPSRNVVASASEFSVHILSGQ